ncbi:unnamed protein product [Anisakis simplex]|uniref:Uncharacterized protein n=1 Tax=Anisakis simplex TaxID=6269 RepID=A0A3P6PG77_ANISI|nr:unnamed protein product [Anisakis simplex]
MEANLLSMPCTSHDSFPHQFTIPDGEQELMAAIEPQLPSNLNVYLRLISSSRQPPARRELLAVAKMAVGGTLSSLEADLVDCEAIFDCLDPMILSGAWYERFTEDCEEGHALWAEIIIRTGCDTAQTLIELAYHLAHSNDGRFPNKCEILRNFGADLIEIRCPVFDYETSRLLVEAGALLLDQDRQVPIPYFVLSYSFQVSFSH